MRGHATTRTKISNVGLWRTAILIWVIPNQHFQSTLLGGGRGVTTKSTLCTLMKMMTIMDDPLLNLKIIIIYQYFSVSAPLSRFYHPDAQRLINTTVLSSSTLLSGASSVPTCLPTSADAVRECLHGRCSVWPQRLEPMLSGDASAGDGLEAPSARYHRILPQESRKW